MYGGSSSCEEFLWQEIGKYPLFLEEGDETDGIVPGNVGSFKTWGTVYLKANVRKLMKS